MFSGISRYGLECESQIVPLNMAHAKLARAPGTGQWSSI
jgi:hypothetical protein